VSLKDHLEKAVIDSVTAKSHKKNKVESAESTKNMADGVQEGEREDAVMSRWDDQRATPHLFYNSSLA
jgi:hypothetical protein